MGIPHGDEGVARNIQTPPTDDHEARVVSLALEIRFLYALQARMRMTRFVGEAAPWLRLNKHQWGESSMPRWDGGRDRQGRVFPSAWEKIARFCLEQGLDPVALIEANFDEAHKKGREPLPPNAMAGGAALRCYRVYQTEYIDCIIMFLKNEHDHMMVKAGERQRMLGETLERALYATLADPTIWLSDLFRYCMGHRGCNSELMEQFRHPALIQYIKRRYAYDRSWGTLITDELRAAADAIFEGMRADSRGPGQTVHLPSAPR